MPLQVPISFAENDGTISSTAQTLVQIGFTQAQVNVADQVTISVTDDAVRFRVDGGVPTASLGHYLAADATPFTITGNADIRRFQFIRVATDAGYLVELSK